MEAKRKQAGVGIYNVTDATTEVSLYKKAKRESEMIRLSKVSKI